YLSWRLATRVSVRLAVAAVSLALIIAVGLSRVYLNVHYLTDVIGGWLAGSAWLLTALLIVDAVESRWRGGLR
ncbi:MAG: phosphatase PAP2 family protein, partial [Bacteroidota bacterium]